MILFLAISGSTGAPCQCDHPWVLLLVALSPPWEVTVVWSHPQRGTDGSETPWRRFPLGRGEKQSILDGAKLRNGRGERGGQSVGAAPGGSAALSPCLDLCCS